MSIQQQDSKLVWVLNTRTGTHSVFHWTITHSSLTARYIPAYEILDVDCNRNSWLGSLSTTLEISSLYILKVTVSLLLYCNSKLTESTKRFLNMPTPIEQMQLPITRIVKSIPWKEICVRIPPGPQKGFPSLAVVIWDSLWRQTGWPYDLSYDISFEFCWQDVFNHDISFEFFFDHMFLMMISPLSFFDHIFLLAKFPLSFFQYMYFCHDIWFE